MRRTMLVLLVASLSASGASARLVTATRGEHPFKYISGGPEEIDPLATVRVGSSVNGVRFSLGPLASLPQYQVLTFNESTIDNYGISWEAVSEAFFRVRGISLDWHRNEHDIIGTSLAFAGCCPTGRYEVRSFEIMLNKFPATTVVNGYTQHIGLAQVTFVAEEMAPEPTAAALFACGLLSLLCCRRYHPLTPHCQRYRCRR